MFNLFRKNKIKYIEVKDIKNREVLINVEKIIMFFRHTDAKIGNLTGMTEIDMGLSENIITRKSYNEIKYLIKNYKSL